MKALNRLRATTIVLAQENIDTDQIIPARFLTTTSRDGLGQHCFADWRYDAEGNALPSELNEPAASRHQILVAGRNFGCGSSREHAPWALLDYGFRVVISSEIADIFRSNAQNNGLLPVIVDEADHQWLLSNPGTEVCVDLPAQYIEFAGGHRARFQIDAFAKHCLVNGTDPLGFLLDQQTAISRFERERAA